MMTLNKGQPASSPRLGLSPYILNHSLYLFPSLSFSRLPLSLFPSNYKSNDCSLQKEF